MKKVLFFLFISLCLYSCSPTDFNIEGLVADKALNGTKIFIKERINRDWKVIDSTVVQDGKFSFKGKVDSTRIAYLAYEYPVGNKVRQAFVFENGNITASIDSSGFVIVKGTTQNNLLQTYQDEKNSFYKRSDKFITDNQDSVKTKEQAIALAKKQAELVREEVNIDKKFVTEHINTLVGTHVFVNSFYGMSTSEKEAIIALMNVETKKVKRIQEIIDEIKIEKKVAVGNQFTDFGLPSIKGDTIKLSDLVGKTDYVLIDFWASWCGPCMHFLPELKSLYTNYKGARFEILGVSLDDSRDAWTGTVQAKQMEWKQVSDLKGWKCEGSGIYAVSSIPCTVLIDKTGKIVGQNLSIPEIENLLLKKAVKKE
jgi:peroxiredoxin/23S rRNA maturation mini-RNase III